MSLPRERGKVPSEAEADEVAPLAPIKWRDAVSCQQTPQPHTSFAPPSPILGEGLQRASVTA